MKRNLATVLILLAALLGQAIASVLPTDCAATVGGAPMNMSVAVSMDKSMPMQGELATVDKCDCCLHAGENCTFAGCFSTALPPALLSSHHPISQCLGTDSLTFQIPPAPISPLFRPPIA
ncbi:hypothetical protein [Microbulbifer hainanensis]|uniref:hypothetical protein n=1 Tax=Microbulbifer hainanensis TaxID=2735675 RepID=UPI00186849D2|nr:hypothetical protein [Microbulbifer hainanensis]